MPETPLNYFQLQTIILLLILATCLGTLLLFLRMHRYLKGESDENVLCRGAQRGDSWEILRRLENTADWQRGMKQVLLEDGKLTRERIAQVKIRLADEERTDQKHLAKERYERTKGGK